VNAAVATQERNAPARRARVTGSRHQPADPRGRYTTMAKKKSKKKDKKGKKKK
jgi:hypothetical protein